MTQMASSTSVMSINQQFRSPQGSIKSFGPVKVRIKDRRFGTEDKLIDVGLPSFEESWTEDNIG